MKNTLTAGTVIILFIAVFAGGAYALGGRETAAELHERSRVRLCAEIGNAYSGCYSQDAVVCEALADMEADYLRMYGAEHYQDCPVYGSAPSVEPVIEKINNEVSAVDPHFFGDEAPGEL